MSSVNFLIHLTLKNFFGKLVSTCPWLKNIAYRLPWSPFRGIIWHHLDKNTLTILDLDVFRGGAGKLIRKREKNRHFIVGIDIHLPYLKKCKNIRTYDQLILADVNNLPFKDVVFDAVLAVEIIEHLQKKDGRKLLKELERLAKHQVIVSTPVGFMEMYHYTSESQKHLSAWYPSEFRKLGWRVYGTYGIRPFPRDFAYWIPFLLPLSYYLPSWVYNMTCIKNTTEK